MSLATYKKKRNFNQTAEPLPEIGKERGARTFVIQRHNASRLHYDFRLEVNGVLKSWAVPKGPSLNPTDKRLAMQVEDHPLSYGSFKGVIPEGNYGAGIVEIWDSGTYDPEEMEKVSDNAIDKNIKNGMLKFFLKGKKLKGSFALVRIRGEESKNWLLIKHRDEYATEAPYNSEDDTPENSPINKFLRQKEQGGAGQEKNKASKSTSNKSASAKSSSAKPASARSSSTRSSSSKDKSATSSSTKSSSTKDKSATSSSTKSSPSNDKSARPSSTKSSSSNDKSARSSSTRSSSPKDKSARTSSAKTSSGTHTGKSSSAEPNPGISASNKTSAKKSASENSGSGRSKQKKSELKNSSKNGSSVRSSVKTNSAVSNSLKKK